MADLKDGETLETLKKMLGRMHNRVTVKFFTQKGCPGCQQQRELLETVAGLGDKITLETHDIDTEKREAERLGIDKVPATTPTAARRTRRCHASARTRHVFVTDRCAAAS